MSEVSKPVALENYEIEKQQNKSIIWNFLQRRPMKIPTYEKKRRLFKIRDT